MFKRLLCIATVLVCIIAATKAFPAGNAQPSEIVNVVELDSYKDAIAGLTTEDRDVVTIMFNLFLKQYGEAIPLLKQIATRHSNDAAAWYLLAFSFNRSGSWQEAYDAAAASMRLQPDAAAPYKERGMASVQLGRYAEAEKDLLFYLKTMNGDAAAHYYRGLALGLLGRLPEARVELNLARIYNPNLAILTNYYIALIDSKQGRFKEALKPLREISKAFEGTDNNFTQSLPKLIGQIQKAEANKEKVSAVGKAIFEMDVKNAPAYLQR